MTTSSFKGRVRDRVREREREREEEEEGDKKQSKKFERPELRSSSFEAREKTML